MASLLIVASAALLLAAVANDLAVRLVPNWVPALLAAAGSALRAVSGTLVDGLLAGAMVFVLALFCWRRGWLGGGDVKLLAAATLTVPPLAVGGLLAAVALAGGVLAALYLLLGAVLPPVRARAPERSASGLGRILRRERRRIARRGPVPYAAAIAAGTFFTLIRH